MKIPLKFTIGCAALLLSLAPPARANESTGLAGSWLLDLDRSSSISPWDRETLDITVTDGVVQIDRGLQWGKDRKVGDVTRVRPNGVTVTTNPVTHWLDTWYNNVYIGQDHEKQVKGVWVSEHRGLQLETTLSLEAQQGEVPVQIEDRYQVSDDGQTLELTQRRSTRDQELRYVFKRVPKFKEPPGMVTTASGLSYGITRHGDGPMAVAGQVVIAHYTGILVDGTVFDSSRSRPAPFAFTLGKKQVIAGWDEGFALLHVGDQAAFIIPPELGYGDKATGPIPAGSTLKFEVELLDLKAHALADHLQEIIKTKGIEAALSRFAELKAGQFADYYVSESQLNALGYGYLQNEKRPEAFAIFKLNVELFPSSGNTHDSLGEAFMKNGQNAEALREYEQSLALDPSNENAIQMIAELKASQ